MPKPNLKSKIKNYTRCVAREHTAKSLATDLKATSARCALLLKELFDESVLLRERPLKYPYARAYVYYFNHSLERKTWDELEESHCVD